MASKAGKGSTRNGRDSNSQRLGMKMYGGQVCKPGNVIVRQRGTEYMPGNNVGMGSDHTIYSLINGVITFERYSRIKKQISVYAAK